MCRWSSGAVGGSNDQRRGAGLEIRVDARGSMCLTCDYSFPCLIWAGDSGMVSLRGRVKIIWLVLVWSYPNDAWVLILIPWSACNQFIKIPSHYCMPQMIIGLNKNTTRCLLSTLQDTSSPKGRGENQINTSIQQYLSDNPPIKTSLPPFFQLLILWHLVYEKPETLRKFGIQGI